MTDLAQLIGRLEAASEGSRALDDALNTAAGEGAKSSWHMTPPVTTSLDAIVALIERKLPDMGIENLGVMRSSGPMTGHWLAQLAPSGPRPRMTGPITAENVRAVLDADAPVSAPTPALALCIAFLRALQAQQETSEDE